MWKLFALAVLVGVASSQTCQWTHRWTGGTGDWTDATKWDLGFTPLDNSQAVLPSAQESYRVALPAAETITIKRLVIQRLGGVRMPRGAKLVITRSVGTVDECTTSTTTTTPPPTTTTTTTTTPPTTTTTSTTTACAPTNCLASAVVDGTCKCTRCSNRMFLNPDGQCRADCPAPTFKFNNPNGGGANDYMCIERGYNCTVGVNCKANSCPGTGEGCAGCIVLTKDKSTCLGCEPEKFILGNKCHRYALCNADKKYLYDNTSVPCSCQIADQINNDKCASCRVYYGDVQGPRCERCKVNFFISDPTVTHPDCLPANQCPEGTVAMDPGRTGGICTTPFTCINGIDDGSPFGCRCQLNCKKCTYNASGVPTCLTCGLARYLHENQCVKATECPVGMTRYGGESQDRECAAPFTCTNKQRPDGTPCRCGTKRCGTCKWEPDNAAGQDVCLACKSPYWLMDDGSCPRTCPKDHRIIDENGIRRCRPPV